MTRRIAFALVSTVLGAGVAVVTTTSSHAQPAGDEIEMGDAGSGSGSGSGSASAPETPAPIQKDPKMAKKVFAAGQQAQAKADAFAKRNKPDDAKAQYELAATSYEKATQLGDDINVYFYLATVEDKLGKFVESVRHFRLVLRAQSGVQPAIQKQVSGKLDEVLGKVGTIALAVTPDGATVTLGGESLGTSPLPEPIVLLPGSYTFSLTAPGFEPRSVEVKIEAGSESERKVELESVKIVIEKPHVIGPEEPEKQVWKKPLLYPALIGGGAAVGFLTVEIIAGVLAKQNHDTFVAAGTRPSARLDAQDAGRSYAHLSDACLLGTVAAAGFGAYWYVFQYRKKIQAHESNVPAKTSKIDVIPWVEPEATGLTVFGRF